MFLSSLALGLAQSDKLADASARGKQLMAEGRYDEAADIYAGLVKALPGNAGLVLNLGLAEEMGGHPERAIAHFQTVLRAQPGNVPALTSVAMAHLQLNQPADAIVPLQKLLSIQQNDVNAIGMLAGAELAMGRNTDAASNYRHLTGLTPKDAKAWYGLGKSYEALASDNFERLAKQDNQSGYVALLLAEARLLQGQSRSAFFFYREAERKAPSLSGVHAGLARVYRNTGHADWAATESARETSMGCGLATGAACRFLQGQYMETARAAGSDAAGLFWKTRAYNALANQSFDKLSQLPESIELHAIKAQMLHGHGRDGEAAKEWRAAMAISPDQNDSRLRMELASSLFQAHDYAAAIPALRELLVSNPQSPDFNFMLGESLWRSQQPDQAVAYLETAVKVSPDLLPAQAALGLTLAALGKNAEAIPHLENALTLDDDGSLQYALARAYQTTGNNEKAQSHLSAYQDIQRKNKEVNGAVAEQSEITPP